MLNDQKSCFISVTSGVPQGSVLGPLLFTIFVNDIPSVVLGPTYMFADDTEIFHFVRSSDVHATLQNDLNILHEWSVRWQLKSNISKCKHVHFGPVHHFGSYYFNGIKIDSVESQKNLACTENVERFTGLNICSFSPMKFFAEIFHSALATSVYYLPITKNSRENLCGTLKNRKSLAQ